MKVKNDIALFALIAFLLFSLAIYLTYIYAKQKVQFGVGLMPRRDMVKVERVEVFTSEGSYIIRLSKGCKGLVMVTNPYQAESVFRALKKVPSMRPVAHDLMVQIFKSYGISVERVEITKLVNRTYYAKILLKKDNSFLTLDARPSDAIAIALRMNADIYVNKALLSDFCRKL